MHRRMVMAAGLAAGLPLRVRAAPAPRVVVIELFTSQGCSSCPPADTLLGRLARRADVIALAWHVDYWDRAAWRDRFSSRAASLRQRAYARQLGSEVFTPALVVGGAKVVIGSQRPVVESAIDVAPAPAVAMSLGQSAAGVDVEIAGAPFRVRAEHIIYDAEAATDVRGGENHGARLREYRIVRDVETLGEWDGSPRRFTLRRASAGQGQVVLLQSADLRIVGAGDLPPT